MKSFRLILTGLATALAAIVLVAPAASLAASTNLVTPTAVTNVATFGSTSGDVTTSLAAAEETGTDDTVADYVKLVSGPKPYKADFTLTLPTPPHRYAVQSFRLQANFLGPTTTQQSWTYSIYNWRTHAFIKIGTPKIKTANTWTALGMPVKYTGSMSDFVDPVTRHIRVRVQASNTKFTAKLDYLALTITSPDVVAAPQVGGCDIFDTNNVWNARIDMLPVAKNSAKYVAALGKSTGLHPDFDAVGDGIPFNVANSGNSTTHSFTFDFADESDPGPYPILNSGVQVEPPGDSHMLTVDTDNPCTLYEIYQYETNGPLTGGSGAIWNLTSNAMRPNGWTSADAAGLPILPGLARYDEVAAGHINHALRFTASKIRDAYIWPASHHATCGASATNMSVPPMGQRFRLKASYSIPSSFGSQTRVILTALKQYGMILADCGSNWFISGEPSSQWIDDQIVGDLKKVPGSAFEAVDESSIQLAPNSYQITP